MRNLFKIFLLTVLLGCHFATAAMLNDVTMSEQIQVGSKKLELNGMGLRKVSKFGIPIKVYVAGLYLEKKSSDSDLIASSAETKRLVLHFVRPVDSEPLVEAFEAGYEKSCFRACDQLKSQFKEFSKNVVSVRKDNEITFTFYDDKLDIETSGPNAKKDTIINGDLSHNLLALFINKKNPPTEDFRKGILGLEQK
jgi:hypothetical protein